MDETKKVIEEEMNAGLTTASLAAVGARSEARALPASSFGVRGSSAAGAATAPAIEEQAAPLFSPEEAKDFRARWDAIQVSFVDEPRRAVEQADAEMFAAERAQLEGQWERGENVSTEDLRLSLRRYRSFFGRLLSV